MRNFIDSVKMYALLLIVIFVAFYCVREIDANMVGYDSKPEEVLLTTADIKEVKVVVQDSGIHDITMVFGEEEYVPKDYHLSRLQEAESKATFYKSQMELLNSALELANNQLSLLNGELELICIQLEDLIRAKGGRLDE